MYIGIGILTASLSFILYHRFFSTSSSDKAYPYSFEAWKRTLSIPGLRFHPRSSKLDGRKASESRGKNDNEDDGDSTPRREGSISGLEAEEDENEEALTPRFQGSSLLPSFALTSDDGERSAGGISHDVGSKKTPPNKEISRSQSEQSLPQESLPHTSWSMPPPARPTSSAKPKPSILTANTTAMMPPPSLPLSSSQPRPTSRQPRRNPSSSLSTAARPPTTLLQPPVSRPTSVRFPATLEPSILSTSTLPAPRRPSKKVLLEPGHSPLDWAFLVQHPPNPTFLRGASAGLALIKVSPSLLRAHNGRRGADAWGVWQGKVYNLTPYLKFHPGGVGEILRAAGKIHEGEKLFMEVHPWVSWEAMLGECLVGILVGEEEGEGEGEGKLEEMD